MSSSNGKTRAPRNRTLTLSESQYTEYKQKLNRIDSPLTVESTLDKIFNNDFFEAIDFFPEKFVDLLIVDPPYNLDKNFNGMKFKSMNDNEYIQYTEMWLAKLVRLLKPTASIYVCGDWKCSSALFIALSKYFKIQNRITWQREKGRGAKSNWKNCSEDIWFATLSDEYYFNAEAVKLKRKVLAPYRQAGKPKDWEESEEGKFRLTSPSNFWDDITIPYWSMPENTDHPTQKPEKLLAKLILASSAENDVVFDPFMGSGTSAVVAKKLKRHFSGLELNEEYCCWAQARVEHAEKDNSIQGYRDGVFWERNSLNCQTK